jgi:2'-5' RNA ligase
MHNRPRPDLPGERRLRPGRRRLFVAADLDEVTRAACSSAAGRLRAAGWTGRWVAPANYHVTVAFLGSVDEALVDRIVAALRALVPQLEPLDVPIDAVGAFPDARRARVAWAGPAEPVPAFGALCRLVRDALAALDLRFDQHADPHVTLARAVGLRAELPYVEPPSTPSLRIGSLTLYESVPAPGGGRYDALEWLPLREAPALS